MGAPSVLILLSLPCAAAFLAAAPRPRQLLFVSPAARPVAVRCLAAQAGPSDDTLSFRTRLKEAPVDEQQLTELMAAGGGSSSGAGVGGAKAVPMPALAMPMGEAWTKEDMAALRTFLKSTNDAAMSA